jgi:hypothetical protein
MVSRYAFPRQHFHTAYQISIVFVYNCWCRDVRISNYHVVLPPWRHMASISNTRTTHGNCSGFWMSASPHCCWPTLQQKARTCHGYCNNRLWVGRYSIPNYVSQTSARHWVLLGTTNYRTKDRVGCVYSPRVVIQIWLTSVQFMLLNRSMHINEQAHETTNEGRIENIG